MITQVLAELNADSALSAIIDGRIYRSMLPDNPTYPLIMFETSREIQNTLSGQSSLQRYIFDWMILGSNYIQCKSIYEALNSALSASANYSNTMIDSDDGQFNDETEQYLIECQSSIWGV